MKDIILGISAYYHDSAAALVIDGEIVAAAQEERFTRKKADSSFPHNAINFCLNAANISLKDVTSIVFYEDYIEKFQRLIYTHHINSPLGVKSFITSMPKWLTNNLWLESQIRKELHTKKKIEFVKHHLSHAASAFYPSPFHKAAILTVDGVGEWSTTTYGIGKGNTIKLLKEIRFPDSLGLFYSAFTYYTGFKINTGEYKVMGLAPYGNPIYVDLIKENLITIYDDGSIKLNMDYFNYTKGVTMTNKKFNELFGGEPRKPESEITQKEMDIACSLQVIVNEIMLKLANHIYEVTKCTNLVLAGGVALNVVAIGHLKRNSKFENIWVQPAASDAGGSLGCALYKYYLDNPRKVDENDSMKSALLGTEIKDKDEEIDSKLKEIGGEFTYFEESELIENIVKSILDNKVVGVARGKMEFGPRALGNRSILGNAQNLDMQSVLNLKIKKRESFRPFAPIVLKEDAKEYFEMDDESPYMLSTYYVKKELRKEQNNELQGMEKLMQVRSNIPAVTHLDYSARVQTVSEESNKFIHKLLTKYKKETKCSVLINTSFNVRGEPIVNDEIDAFNCFMNTDMDFVVIGNRFFDKNKQNIELYNKYKSTLKGGAIELD